MFFNGDQLLALREERHDGKKNWYDVNDAKLKEIVTNLNGTDHCLILRTKNIGAWMNVRGTMVTGILLVAKTFRGFYVYVIMLLPLT